MATTKAPPRGPELLSVLLRALASDRSPVGAPSPLDAAALADAEVACGVALSPSMHALLSFDAGWMRREHEWIEPVPAGELMAAHAGEAGEAYRAFAAQRLPGLALPLDEGSDSMRFLYLGDPDELGEYPVLFIDHDDLPVVGVEDAGLDVWLARQLDVAGDKTYAAARKLAAQRIFGRAGDVSVLDVPAKLPPPVAGPAPGSVQHRAIAAAPTEAPKKARKLTDKQLEKALVSAADDGQLDAVRAAIADIGARGLGTECLDRALLAAAGGWVVDIVRALLDAGASPSARTATRTALEESTRSSTDANLALLIERGADIDALTDGSGRTALFSAVERGAPARVRMLIAAGADPNRVDSNGLTPLHEAVRRHPGTGNVPPVEVLDALLEHGARIDAGDTAWRPVLHTAIDSATAAHVQRLLAAGADPNRRARFRGNTPLHAAYEARKFDLAPVLLAAGADRTIPNETGDTTEPLFGPAGELLKPPSY